MKVSVIMSVYNETIDLLFESINSILKQTFSDFEFIIVDDNPSLNLTDNIKSLDSRIIILKNDVNLGLSQSLNKAIEISRGEFIARMDADDVSDYTRLEKQVEFLTTYPEIDMVHTGAKYINNNGDFVGIRGTPAMSQIGIKKALGRTCCILHPSVMIRSKVLKNLGGYRPYPTSEDYDLWLRLLDKGHTIGYINESLISCRTRPESMTNSDLSLTFLVSNYQNSMFKRKLINEDFDYIKANMERYLNKKGYYTKRKKISESIFYQRKTIEMLRNKHIFPAIKNFSLAVKFDLCSTKYLLNFISYKFESYLDSLFSN